MLRGSPDLALSGSVLVAHGLTEALPFRCAVGISSDQRKWRLLIERKLARGGRDAQKAGEGDRTLDI